MEIIIFSALEGLSNRIERYRDLAVLAPSRLDQAMRLITSERPPQVVYLDDSRDVPPNELWQAVAAAQSVRARILLNFQGAARSGLNDARGAGLAAISERDPALVAEWIAAQLSLRQTNVVRVPIVAVAAAKGGVGKTFLACTLAEGLRRRGLRVLLWDSDISNPGLVQAFRIPASAPSFLHLARRGAAHDSHALRSSIFQPAITRPTPTIAGSIDLLVGSHSLTRPEDDLRLSEWQQLYDAVTRLDDYDIILIDTPPDYLRRPYATHTLQSGGWVVLPCPAGARERMGVGHLMDHFREHAPERIDTCMLTFLEPEYGSLIAARDVIGLFARRYPQVRALGILPRAARLASRADEHDGYISPIDLGPHSHFTNAAHGLVDSLCQQLALRPKQPRPSLPWWVRFFSYLRGEQVFVPAAGTSLATLARRMEWKGAE